MWRRLLTMPFYSVARGRTTGVFSSWKECEDQVKGFTGAVYKKFSTLQEAESFVITNKNGYNGSTGASIATAAPKRAASSSADWIRPSAKKPRSTLTTEAHTQNIAKMDQIGGQNFLVDTEGFVHVYTDGSCENNGQRNACAGLGVYFAEGHPLNVSAPVVGPPTNNRGEIQAATKAIQLSAGSGVKKLCINTDSQFLINSVTKWMPGWIGKGWKLASGGLVKNVDDFRALDRAMKENRDMQVKWTYVPAHVGILGNERADTLAKEGAQMYRRGH